jgi:hypothetical protein
METIQQVIWRNEGRKEGAENFVLPHLHVLKKVGTDCHSQRLQLITKQNMLVMLIGVQSQTQHINC